MTIKLANNEEGKAEGGRYSFKVTGALDLQMQIATEGFTTLTDGGFTTAADGIIELPVCTLKAINATTESILLKPVTK